MMRVRPREYVFLNQHDGSEGVDTDVQALYSVDDDIERCANNV